MKKTVKKATSTNLPAYRALALFRNQIGSVPKRVDPFFPIVLLFFYFTFFELAFAQHCHDEVIEPADFKFVTQTAQFETGWYDEWLEHTNGEKILPKPLPALDKWEHPYMKYGFTSAMHEDSHSSDVSNLAGPLPHNPKVQYFHVLQKKGGFSGMCPAFDFVNDSTLVTLSFGRKNTTLLLLNVTDTITVLDQIEVPGRGTNVMELIGKKGREKVFHNTAGGAYSYLSNKDHYYIPGANNNILRIQIKDGKFEDEIIESVNIRNQVDAGDLVDEHLHEKDKMNLLTALMPDTHGNIWFTSRHGIVGLLHRDELTEEGCMKVYASYIGFFGAIDKINKHFGSHFKSFEDIELYREIEKYTPEFKNKFREMFMTTEDTREEIQNSFSVGKDGVYIVSNYALYKLRFNEERKIIELDPNWVEAYKEGDLVYANDRTVKPGQLNAGSGTTPTLMDDRFVAICDNDSRQVNLCIYSQKTGRLVSKHKLFSSEGGAVENSVVAYGNSFIVANTYGYEDPFEENKTPGGIMRFDYNEDKGVFEQVPDWPRSGVYDCKTATPKLSTPVGMMYVYNRSEEDYQGHYDWQITGIDYMTGLRVFYIRPFFERGDFGDNINFLLKWGSLGSKHYERKVFNNIWGTFTFGPDNSFYIGAYRGFIRVSSN